MDICREFQIVKRDYETACHIDPRDVVDSCNRGKASVPQSPEMREFELRDQIERVIGRAAAAAEYWCHELLDAEAIAWVPPATSAQLTVLARNAERLDDAWQAGGDLSRQCELDELAALRADLADVARLAWRRIQTPEPCLSIECPGRYVYDMDGSDDIKCDRCGDTVPYSQWGRWHSITGQRAA